MYTVVFYKRILEVSELPKNDPTCDMELIKRPQAVQIEVNSAEVVEST